MERKRIIIETGEDIADGDQYKSLTEKLNSIEKKLQSPWVMPLLLAAIGASFTLINYLVQRNYVNEDLYKNKVREKVAEQRAIINVGFYITSIEAIDSLDDALHTYCEFDESDDNDSLIQNKLAQLNSVVRHRRYVDTAAADCIHKYTEFVAIKVYKIDTTTNKEIMEARYQESLVLYKTAYALLIKGMENMKQ